MLMDTVRAVLLTFFYRHKYYSHFLTLCYFFYSSIPQEYAVVSSKKLMYSGRKMVVTKTKKGAVPVIKRLREDHPKRG